MKTDAPAATPHAVVRLDQPREVLPGLRRERPRDVVRRCCGHSVIMLPRPTPRARDASEDAAGPHRRSHLASSNLSDGGSAIALPPSDKSRICAFAETLAR